MENQTQDEKLLEMFSILDELFSLNYSCLRISNQNQPLDEIDTIRNSKEVFAQSKTLRDTHIKNKLEEATEIRNEIFKAISQGWEAEKTSSENFKFNTKLKKQQDALTNSYNEYYGKNSTFNQIFNGFNTLDPKFFEIIKSFDTKKVVNAENEKLSKLLQAYFEYIETLKTRMKYKGFDDIFNILKNDINETTGRPSHAFGKTANSSVTLMTLDEIEMFVNHANLALKNVQKEIQKENKNLVPLYKKGRKNFNDYETHNQISEIKSNIFNLLETERVAKHYLDFAKSLYERLVCANNDYDNSLSSTLFENLGDVFSGINIFNKNNELLFAAVYVHKLEKSYLSYLSKLFKESPTLSSQKPTSEVIFQF